MVSTLKHSETLHESGLLEAFAVMDRRRLERFACGRTQARSSQSSFVRSVGLFVLLLVLLTQVTLKRSGQLAKIVRSGWVTLGLLVTSAMLVISTLHDCLSTRDHVLSKAGLCVFSVCALWYLREFEFARDSPFEFSQAERFIIGVFGAIELALLLVYLCVYVLYVKLGKWLSKHRLGQLADLCWYRFRRESEHSFSYSPYGLLGRRHVFSYEGERSAVAPHRPHGRGVWRDDSAHGETLHGNWEDGNLVGFFQSMEKSSEALFVCHPILVATSRAENFSSSLWFPRRDARGLRFALADVECSYGSAYYRNLPRVRNVREFQGDLQQTVQKHTESAGVHRDDRRRRSGGFLQVETVENLDAVGDSEMRTIQGFLAGNKLYIKHQDLENPQEQTTQGSSSREALIFFHGFNCPAEFAASKLAQLLAVGKFPSHIVPVVFSQSAGKALSYFPALRALEIFAKDAAELMERLRSEAGIEKFHLLGHSMGCDLLLQTVEELRKRKTLSPASRGTPTTYKREEEKNNVKLENVILLNGDVDLDIFMQDHLDNLEKFANLTTILVDRNDQALWYGEVGKNVKKVGRMKRVPWSPRSGIDILDATDMQHNVHSMRHSYFNLNVQIVGELEEILTSGRSACERRTLALRTGGTYAFLCTPAFITADRARA